MPNASKRSRHVFEIHWGVISLPCLDPFFRISSSFLPLLSPLFPHLAMSSSTSGVKLTTFPAIKNAPFPAEGNGSFNNLIFAGILIVVPWFVKGWIPFVSRGGFFTYIVVGLVTGLPTAMVYWTVMSKYGPRKNEKLKFPGKPISDYIEFVDDTLREKYSNGNKIPMQVAYDSYFDGKLNFKGESLRRASDLPQLTTRDFR